MGSFDAELADLSLWEGKELDDLKMLVVEVGIDRITQNESSLFVRSPLTA
jgi:hypothetical protein